jgi:hypothetical protein
MKGTSRMGFTLLGVWLILMGLSQLILLSFAFMTPLLGVLALLAGVLIVAGR